jgi:hypothetical protein
MQMPDLQALQRGDAAAWDRAFPWLWPAAFGAAQVTLRRFPSAGPPPLCPRRSNAGLSAAILWVGDVAAAASGPSTGLSLRAEEPALGSRRDDQGLLRHSGDGERFHGGHVDAPPVLGVHGKSRFPPRRTPPAPAPGPRRWADAVPALGEAAHEEIGEVGGHGLAKAFGGG